MTSTPGPNNLTTATPHLPWTCAGDGQDGSQRLSALFAGQKRKEVESCTRKCVPTCVRGGSDGGAPGLGPLSVRKEIVVFKVGLPGLWAVHCPVSPGLCCIR